MARCAKCGTQLEPVPRPKVDETGTVTKARRQPSKEPLTRKTSRKKQIAAVGFSAILAIALVFVIITWSNGSLFYMVNGYVNVNMHYSSSPAPIGMADYGVQTYQGKTNAYKLQISSVTGTSTIYALSSYNLANPSDDTMSLQLNAVLVVNTTAGAQLYWLQNAEGFATALHQWTHNGQTVSNPYAYFWNNIWSYNHPPSSLSNVAGNGKVNEATAGGQNVYMASGPFGQYSSVPYSFPFQSSLTLTISQPMQGSNVGGIGYNYAVQVKFGMQVTQNPVGITGTYTYDTVTIGETSPIQSAYILVDGSTMSIDPFVGMPHYYDVEYVFAGRGNGENVQLDSMDATMNLSYTLLNGQTTHPYALYQFGSDTNEGAANICSGFNGQGQWVLTTGQADFHNSMYIGP